VDWLRRHAQAGAPLADERDNVLSVLRVAIDEGLAEPAWALVEAVNPHLTAAEEHPYRLRLWQAGEAAALALHDDRKRVQALRGISYAYAMSGQVRRELATAEQALALAEPLGDPWETAQSVRRVGDALRAQDRFDAAEAALHRALDMFVDLGAVTQEIEVLSALGTLYNTFWRPADSTPVLERALSLLPSEESSWHGWVLGGLSLAYRFAGRTEEAARLNERAFGVARRIHDDFLLGYCHQERAWAAAAEGRLADAERDFREMLAIFERIGHGSGVASARAALGTMAGRDGRHAEALAAFDAALTEFNRLGQRVRAGEVRLDRAAILDTLGRTEEAVRDRAAAEKLIGDAPVHRESPPVPPS
jgi:tetratricopeptide (TPR) repeat protein